MKALQARRDRTLGQARVQYEIIHRHGVYDVEVDTSLLDPQECARRIVQRVTGGAGPAALRLLRQRGPTCG